MNNFCILLSPNSWVRWVELIGVLRKLLKRWETKVAIKVQTCELKAEGGDNFYRG